MYSLNPSPYFQLIGHRGAAGLAPENTAIAFEVAKAWGLNWVEIDVQICGSGELVVFHDQGLERTTNGIGRLQQASYHYLRGLDAGSWFHPRFTGQRVLSLQEALEHLLALNLQVNIEIKCHDNEVSHLLRKIFPLLERAWPAHQALPLVSSFNLHLLQTIRRHERRLPLGYLLNHYTPQALSLCAHHQFNTLHCAHTHITIDQIRSLHQAKLPVLLYTVNEPEEASALLNVGVSAIFTDRPDRLIGQSVMTPD